MFEIYGIINENDFCRADRLCANLTCVIALQNKKLPHPKAFDGDVFDFTHSFSEFEKNFYILRENKNKKVVILPPFYNVAEFYAGLCDKIIVTFPTSDNLMIGPFVTIKQLERVLEWFSPVRDKTLIMLSGLSRDYSINTHSLKYITNNQAQLKGMIKQSLKFTSDELGCSYFTYLNESGEAHIVYIEDTHSLSLRHNMIKGAGFAGICWDNASAMTEGNWEALKAAYMAVGR